MSVRRKTGSKPLAFITALMVVLALAIPFTGAALANHTADPDTVTLTPDTDSAAVATCNEFTLSARQSNGNRVAEGETIDVRAFQSDSDVNQDLQIAFCDPDGTGPASNLGGPQPDPASGQQTGSGTANVDCDDNGNTPNAGACPGTGTGAEAPAEILDECFTDANGNCTFGVTSNEAGTMTVEAWFDTNNDNDRDTGEPFDTSTKTWTGQPPGAARNITCTPATDSNPENTRHEFQCTVTDANGTALSGVTVQFDVTAGPNSEEVGRTECGPTNASGQTAAPATENPPGSGQNPGTPTANACGYNDFPAATSAPGTDTITAWVNLATQPGQPPATLGPDSGEPTTTITKTWVGQERVIDCEPETDSNPVGTTHTVTCTVTDAGGRTVQGAQVDFTETGPATPNDAQNVVTDANGQATFTIQTNLGDAAGTSTVRGDITGSPGNECTQAAGTPSGAPAGVCFDDVTKTWTRQQAPECNDNIDNDGDGRIDFPNDRGCASVDDNSEDSEGTGGGQQFGGEVGQQVSEGACAGFTTGSVQQNSTDTGLIVVGTNGPDALVGSEGNDLICALDDDDSVQGLGGNDTIFGGGGKDAIEAGLGDDTVFGEGDKDVILGDGGNDELDGGQGNDNMSGGDDADVLLGRGGWDTLKGNAGDDLLVGAKGRDILQGGGGNDTARGGADDDVLKGYIGNDELRGGGGDDIIKGAAGRDRLFGNAGDDILNGGSGRDACRGGRGNDILRNCP